MKTQDGFHFVMPVSSKGVLAGDSLADNFDGGTDSQIVCMSKYKTAYFLVHWGVGTTGQLTITAVPCDDATPSHTTTAIPFQYKKCSVTETETAWTTSSSLYTDPASSSLYVIKVQAENLPQVAGVKYEYVKLAIAETDDDPLLGGCIIMMADPRYDEAILDGVTV